MLALLVVRDGVLQAGAAEAVEECHGNVLVAADGGNLDDALESLTGLVASVTCVDLGGMRPAMWAKALAPLVDDSDVVVLPASADGRDMAPHLAHRLGRTLRANAVRVTPESAEIVADAGMSLRAVPLTGPSVVTMQPGVRSTRRIVAGGAGVDTPERCRRCPSNHGQGCWPLQPVPMRWPGSAPWRTVMPPPTPPTPSSSMPPQPRRASSS
ncbi:MAG: hypothetical protein M3337_07240 [Actinomycetota bacterium]|nr:hypothetical protein [Actinomycetota bacterium]